MESSIVIKAGRTAMRILQDEGLEADRVKVLAGASGGPKWLVLGGIDRVLPEFFRQRKNPLYCIGSSIGTWRMAALAQKDPLRALELFEEGYLEQHYTAKPDAAEVTRESQRIMDLYVDDRRVRELLTHPYIRLSMLTNRSKGILSTDRPFPLAMALLVAGTANLLGRRNLRYFFERALFYDSRDLPPFYGMNEFPIERVSLTAENLRAAVMASGSIPLAMLGIRDIPGAQPGTYRDGGIIDYHLDIPFLPEGDEGLVLYPHFFDHIVPGWFDKALSWRAPLAANIENVVLVAPSDGFVAKLPDAKVPDRDDFKRYRGRQGERVAAWRSVVNASRRLGEEFMEAVLSGRVRTMAKPLMARER